jgi:hypothetical protein
MWFASHVLGLAEKLDDLTSRLEAEPDKFSGVA